MIIDVKKEYLLKLVCETLNSINKLEHEAYYTLKCIKEYARGNKLPFMKLKRVHDIVKPYTISVYVKPFEIAKDIYDALLIHEDDIISVDYSDIKFLESWKDFKGYRDWLIDDYKKHLQKQFFSITIPTTESIDGYVKGNSHRFKKEDFYEQAKKFNT